MITSPQGSRVIGTPAMAIWAPLATSHRSPPSRRDSTALASADPSQITTMGRAARTSPMTADHSAAARPSSQGWRSRRLRPLPCARRSTVRWVHHERTREIGSLRRSPDSPDVGGRVGAVTTQESQATTSPRRSATRRAGPESGDRGLQIGTVEIPAPGAG